MKKYFAAMIFLALTLSACGMDEDTAPAMNSDAAASISETTTTAAESDTAGESTTETDTAVTTAQDAAAETTSPVTDAPTESESNTDTANGVVNPEMETVIRSLTDKNVDCLLNIFVVNMLPYEETPALVYDDPDTYLAKCTSDRFPTYQSLVDYLNTVYTESYTHELLDEQVDSQKKYVEVDGALYCNRYLDGGIGYYVDWSNYKVSIDALTDTRCDFTITAKMDMPDEVVKEEEYSCSAIAVLENGTWKLASMFDVSAI
ncbi:MAG: IseA DL-endopeptidase inhibitor family protein [Oscillospiraceae bacterium]|nr:IseA DL-endopeptidase inhibitor family protein [Oscillospiraceae bacterium]